MAGPKEPKEVTLTMNNSVFTMELAVRDWDLIRLIFDVLRGYVEQGQSLKVRESYMTSPSDSVKMISKIISKARQVDEWRGETRQLISILSKQARD